MKKIISLFLSILMVVTMFPLSVFAEEIVEPEEKEVLIEEPEETPVEVIDQIEIEGNTLDATIVESGYCGGEGDGTNLEWVLTRDGTLTISGEGEMADYYSDAPWQVYKSILKKLVIEEGVTIIGDHAFDGCSGFTGDLIIPNSVTSIGMCAFTGCSGFTGDLTIPEGVTYVDAEAFEGCSGFDGTLTIPGSLTKIEFVAFYGCSGFKKLVIKEGVTTIGMAAFDGCSGFTGELVIPDSVTTIGDSAFSGCSGFTGELVIPDSVTTIGDLAFSGCSDFTGELVIPDSVTTIGDFAFRGCSGINGILVISKNAKTIGDCAFGGTGISEFMVSSSNTNYCSSDGIIYSKDKKTLLVCAPKKVGKVSIPYGVETIGNYAFAGCYELTGTLSLPSSLKIIGTNAFEYCSGFTGNLSFPSGLTSIGSNAFCGCSGFTGNLSFPSGVTSIGSYAFSGCSGIDGTITIHEGITDIGIGSFITPSAKNIIVDENNEKYFSDDGILYAYAGGAYNSQTLLCCPAGRTKPVELVEGTAEIESYAFYGCDKIGDSMIFPETIKRISTWAFWNSSITKIYAKGKAPSSWCSPSPFDNENLIIYYEPGMTGWEDWAKRHGVTAIENSCKSEINITSGTIATAKTKTVIVEIAENSNASMIQFTLGYDPSALKLVSCSVGSIVEDATINDTVEGEIKFIWEKIGVLNEGGALLELEFTTADNVVDQVTKVEILTEEKTVFANSEMTDIEMTYTGGEIEIIAMKYGDINDDGFIDVKDVYLARLIAAQLIDCTEKEMLAGDVDGDGKITALDANYIRKYAIESIDSFPVEYSL